MLRRRARPQRCLVVEIGDETSEAERWDRQFSAAPSKTDDCQPASVLISTDTCIRSWETTRTAWQYS
jgi:hypothetical protein